MSGRIFRSLATVAVAGALSFSAAWFFDPAQAKRLSAPVVVVELFTSQGCAACRPADDMLANLAGQDGVLVLSFHVDTWDYAGWQDPFALDAATERQTNYAHMIGRATAYTPEMVINGVTHIPGLDPETVGDAVETAAQRAATVPLKISHDAEQRLRVTITEGTSTGVATIWLLAIDRRHATEVPAGENQGATIVNYNVVRTMARIGSWAGDPLDLHLPATQTHEIWDKGEGCAVLLQLEETGEILGAQILWFHDG